jgi:hypothetical protein
MFGGSFRFFSFGVRVRGPFPAAGLLVALVIAAVCGTLPSAATTVASAATSAATTVASTSRAPGSCAGVPGAHHARLVVEPAAGKVVARCVGFAGKRLAALKLVQESHIEVGTETFSFGVAICQVDDVPAHYAQCLPPGQDYWALFLSTNGRTWTSPSVGVSDITVPPGGSLGLRYDSPNGTPAPPPHPTPA